MNPKTMPNYYIWQHCSHVSYLSLSAHILSSLVVRGEYDKFVISQPHVAHIKSWNWKGNIGDYGYWTHMGQTPKWLLWRWYQSSPFALHKMCFSIHMIMDLCIKQSMVLSHSHDVPFLKPKQQQTSPRGDTLMQQLCWIQILYCSFSLKLWVRWHNIRV